MKNIKINEKVIGKSIHAKIRPLSKPLHYRKIPISMT